MIENIQAFIEIQMRLLQARIQRGLLLVLVYIVGLCLLVAALICGLVAIYEALGLVWPPVLVWACMAGLCASLGTVIVVLCHRATALPLATGQAGPNGADPADSAEQNTAEPAEGQDPDSTAPDSTAARARELQSVLEEVLQEVARQRHHKTRKTDQPLTQDISAGGQVCSSSGPVDSMTGHEAAAPAAVVPACDGPESEAASASALSDTTPQEAGPAGPSDGTTTKS